MTAPSKTVIFGTIFLVLVLVLVSLVLNRDVVLRPREFRCWGGTLRLLLPGRIYGCSTRHLVVLIFLALVPLTRGTDDWSMKLTAGQ